jgi:pyruvate dehydrogenase E2 component (dihydrolipoamide acetyltransferase)
MTEGRLLHWLVDEGAELAVGDEVAEVETEKITGAVESPAAGVLRRLVVWGREDRVIPSAHAERAPEAADVRVIDAAGHSPHMEAAGDVNRILEGFLVGAR